jgi:hypothetical protein
MGKNLTLALVACLIAIPAVGAEPKSRKAQLHATALAANKANAPKAAVPATQPSTSADAPINTYQLEQDSCCYGTTK